MTEERRQQLFKEAAARNNKRLAAEKKERARLRSIASAEKYCKLRELAEEEKRRKREEKERLRNERERKKRNAQYLLKIYTNWKKELDERLITPELLEDYVVEWNTHMSDSLANDIDYLINYIKNKQYKN